MSEAKKSITRNPQMTWLQGGAALSLAWMAWALLRGRRKAARMGFSLAASCLARLGDLRLQAHVSELLSRAEAGDGEAPYNPVDSWRMA